MKITAADIWTSDRGLMLITQPCNIPEDRDYPIITVERHCKWYDLYIGYPHESPRKLLLDGGTTFEDDMYAAIHTRTGLWVDHALIPRSVVRLAKLIKAKIELQVYDAICRRYLQDIMWTRVVFTEEFAAEMQTPADGRSTPFSYPPNYPTTADLMSVIIDADKQLLD